MARNANRGWFAEATRELSQEMARKYDESIWSYRDRPATRTRRLKTLETTKSRADLLYSWSQGSLMNAKGN